MIPRECELSRVLTTDTNAWLLFTGSSGSGRLLTSAAHTTVLMVNYIMQCGQLCPDYIARLLVGVSTSVKSENAVLAVVHWRLIRS